MDAAFHTPEHELDAAEWLSHYITRWMDERADTPRGVPADELAADLTDWLLGFMDAEQLDLLREGQVRRGGRLWNVVSGRDTMDRPFQSPGDRHDVRVGWVADLPPRIEERCPEPGCRKYDGHDPAEPHGPFVADNAR